MEEFSKLRYLKTLHGVDISATCYRVLVTISDYTDRHGKRAWPGIEKLVEDCRLSRSTVKRSLCELEQTGWLHLDKRGRKGMRSEYSLSTPQGVTGDTIRNLNGSPVDAQGVTSDPLKGSPMTPLSNPLTDPLTDPDNLVFTCPDCLRDSSVYMNASVCQECYWKNGHYEKQMREEKRQRDED
jgi:predicted transcriptional regulator